MSKPNLIVYCLKKLISQIQIDFSSLTILRLKASMKPSFSSLVLKNRCITPFSDIYTIIGSSNDQKNLSYLYLHFCKYLSNLTFNKFIIFGVLHSETLNNSTLIQILLKSSLFISKVLICNYDENLSIFFFSWVRNFKIFILK